MKKIICLVLCAVMLFGLLGVSAGAEERLQLKFADVAAAPGDEIEVLLSAENTPGLKGLTCGVDFDDTVLTYVGYTAKTTVGNWSIDSFADDHILQWIYDGITNGQMLTYDGTELIALRFQVSADAKPGEYPITLTFDPDWDAVTGVKDNYVWTIEDFDIVPGTVTVTGDEPEPLTDGFYLLVGHGDDGWGVEFIKAEHKFEPNPNNESEYMLTTNLVADYDEIKVVRVENGAITGWWPNGAGTQYHVDAAHAGDVVIYFKTDYQDGWSEFGGYFYIAAVPPTPTVFAEVYGSSLSLNGNIALNFFVIVPDELREDEAAYVTLNDEQYLINAAKQRTVGEDTLYQFTVEMHAKQMNDEVVLRVYEGDGTLFPLQRHSNQEDVTAGYSYSVMAYIEKVRETSTDEKFVALVNAMSDFGSAAQTQFGYNLENCPAIQADLDAVTAETVADYEMKVTEGTATGVSFYGGSLVLESATAIRLYFTLDEGEIGDYTFRVNGGLRTPEAKDEYWMIEIPNVAAKNLDKTWTVTVTSSAGKVVTVEYSALSYAYKALSENITDPRPELVKALVLYNQAADAYFG